MYECMNREGSWMKESWIWELGQGTWVSENGADSIR